MILQGTALVPGTCGELVQGTLSGGNFLVTCPVNWFSRVTVAIQEDVLPVGCGVSSTQGKWEDASSSTGIVFPAERIKTAQAVRRALDREGCPGLGGGC